MRTTKRLARRIESHRQSKALGAGQHARLRTARPSPFFLTRAAMVSRPFRPDSYRQAAEDLPGFLCAPQRLAQPTGSSRQAALDRLAASRQAAAAAELAADRAAAAHCRRQLARRTLEALRLAVAAGQQQTRLAAQQNRKWTYCRYAAAFAAWHTAADRRRRLLLKTREADALRRHTLAAHALAALQRHAARQRAKRRSWVQAESFHAFCLLTRSLDGWRAAVQRRSERERLTAAAVLHWAARLARRTLALWGRHVQHHQLQRRQAELASAYCRHSVLSQSLTAWGGAVRRLATLRQAAEHTIRQALFGSPHQLAGMCLRSWRELTRRQQRHRDDLDLAWRYRRASLLGVAWRGSVIVLLVCFTLASLCQAARGCRLQLAAGAT